MCVSRPVHGCELEILRGGWALQSERGKKSRFGAVVCLMDFHSSSGWSRSMVVAVVDYSDCHLSCDHTSFRLTSVKHQHDNHDPHFFSRRASSDVQYFVPYSL